MYLWRYYTVCDLPVFLSTSQGKCDFKRQTKKQKKQLVFGFIKGEQGSTAHFSVFITEENKAIPIPILPPSCTPSFVSILATETFCVLLQVTGRLFCAAN